MNRTPFLRILHPRALRLSPRITGLKLRVSQVLMYLKSWWIRRDSNSEGERCSLPPLVGISGSFSRTMRPLHVYLSNPRLTLGMSAISGHPVFAERVALHSGNYERDPGRL